MISKATTYERYVIPATLAAYPLLALLVRGWVSALFFIVLILSFASLVRSRVWLERANWDAAATAFALAMASAAVAILVSQIYHQSFKWRPYDEASRLLFAVPIFLAVRASRISVSNRLGASCALGALLAVPATLWDFNVGSSRVGSYFLNVIHFGDIALMLGFLALFSLDVKRPHSIFSVVLKISGLCAGLYLSFRSGTRGGWIAIPVLLGIWVFVGNRIRLRNVVTMSLILFGLVGIVGYFMFDLISQRFVDLYSDFAAFEHGNKDTSAGIRLQILHAVVVIFQANPLFGAGPDGYKAALSLLAKSDFITPAAAELGMAEVHNQILNYAVKYGAIGLISGLAIHFVPLVIFARRLRDADGGAEARAASLMGICLVTGFFIFGLSVEIFNLKGTITFYSLTLATLLAAATRGGGDEAVAGPTRISERI